MYGWLLYKHLDYSPAVLGFLKTAEVLGIKLQVIRPQLVDLFSSSQSCEVFYQNSSIDLPEFCISWMGSGTDYSGLSVLRFLEALGVITVNRSDSIQRAVDKYYAMQLLSRHALPIPKSILLSSPCDPDSALVRQTLGFPVILKTVTGSDGRGVFLARTYADFLEIVYFLQSAKAASPLLAQEFIKTSHGESIRVYVVDQKIVGCFYKKNDASYKSNLFFGGKEYPLDPNDSVKSISLMATEILGLTVAGVDLLVDRDDFKICEVNTAPGFHAGIEAHFQRSLPEEIYRVVNSSRSQK